MRIGATHSKGTHTRDEALLGLWPLTEAGLDTNWNGFPGNVRIPVLEVEASGQLAVLQRKNRFQNAGQSGSRFEMSNVLLHAADGEWIRTSFKNRSKPLDFNWVS